MNQIDRWSSGNETNLSGAVKSVRVEEQVYEFEGDFFYENDKPLLKERFEFDRQGRKIEHYIYLINGKELPKSVSTYNEKNWLVKDDAFSALSNKPYLQTRYIYDEFGNVKEIAQYNLEKDSLLQKWVFTNDLQKKYFEFTDFDSRSKQRMRVGFKRDEKCRIAEIYAYQPDGKLEVRRVISFDKNDLYVFSRRHHYEFIFNHIGHKQEKENPEYIIDDNGSTDFKKAVLDCFNIEYDKIWQTIVLVMEHFKLKYGDCVSAEQNGFLRDIENYSETSLASIEKLLSGMTLTKENKMILPVFLKKPHSLNKYLYRPFLLWTINQKKYYVFGTASLFEAEASLYLNAIPWGKVPTEWSDNASFIQYKNKKQLEHDKWLDDDVEKSIKTTGLIYQRSVKKLITKKQSYSLEVKDLGEIDFLIVSPHVNKVFIAECKHLQGRYDMVNQKEDYDHFTKDGKDKCYNTRLNLKTKWLTENKAILEEHLQLRFKDPNLSLKDYQIEGVFFINTPTFYMYNSDLRIYTFEQVVDVITGKHTDP
ncbi:MAG TPA: hypothetical protein PKE69_08680, partial [Pyrinomonadaceae bacterium]|nr:hypothetical protein [Pyrinomonadaceae bacterium]